MDDRVRNLGERLELFARQRARDELDAALREPWEQFTHAFAEHMRKQCSGPASLAGLFRTLPDAYDNLFKLAAPAVEAAAVERMADSIIKAADTAGADRAAV